MRIIRKAREEGFTLIELMIVVAIVGVLAVLAVYGVRKYIANSKTAEARNSLGQISKDSATAFEREFGGTAVIPQGSSSSTLRSLCASSTQPIPSSSTSIQGKKYQSSPSLDWNKDATAQGVGFACLKYSMDQPQYYQYNYIASGSAAAGDSFTALANGDLNGDTILSTFSIVGAIGSGMVLNIAPSISESQPEE